jgi:pimeloyl-ACP methyl ester carboxylesterase
LQADHPKQTKEEINNTPATSGLSDDIIANDSQMLAYDDITKIVAKLLLDNPHAQLFVTGHSLGGALAAVYGAMLHYNAETEITDRLAAIYTFGQPRVGDQNFANYANEKLKGHYNRVVYCNDIVPRVPFDNKLFQFKHFGGCHYYDSWYNGMVCTQYSSLADFLGILSSRNRCKSLVLAFKLVLYRNREIERNVAMEKEIQFASSTLDEQIHNLGCQSGHQNAPNLKSICWVV